MPLSARYTTRLQQRAKLEVEGAWDREERRWGEKN